MELNDGGHYFERAAIEAGNSFADLVRRPTQSATDLPDSEIGYSSEQFEEKMTAREVSLLIVI